MKRCLILFNLLIASITLLNNAQAQQNCFYGVVLSETQVELRFRCAMISTTNLYGISFQRRNGDDSVFIDLLDSFCPAPLPPNPANCSYTDARVHPGIWFYRAMQMDLDGTRAPIDVMIRVEVGTTSVKEVTPAEFELVQNYPNPFNPTTTIKYEIPNLSEGVLTDKPQIVVTLKVFDLLGREVATLVNEVKLPGSYALQWDASGLASGVYFYRLQAGGFVEAKKLIVIR